MKITLIILGVLVILILGGALLFLNACEDDWCYVYQWQKLRAADSFERCASLGFPVMESSPRQCSAGSKTFTENTPPPAQADMIHVFSPLPNSLVTSPLTITGEARGGWYFEASFQVRLLDANNLLLAASPAQAQSDWMTPNFVPFQVTLIFSPPTTATGTLILEKDNPSGEPANAAEVDIPVQF